LHAWTIWAAVFIAVGPILITLFTVIYSAIKPGWIWSMVYGNNIYLFRSAMFWFSFVFCFFLSLIPRYLVRYYKELYYPTDIDVLKWIGKTDPDHDYYHDPLIPGGAQTLATQEHVRKSQAGELHEDQLVQPSLSRRQTDMSGLAPVNSRGFAFAQEDEIGAIAVGRPLRTYTNSLHEKDKANRPRSGSLLRVRQAFGLSPKKEAQESANLRKKSLLSIGRSRAQSRAYEEDGSPVLSTIAPSPASPNRGTSSRPVTPVTSARPATPASPVREASSPTQLDRPRVASPAISMPDEGSPFATPPSSPRQS